MFDFICSQYHITIGEKKIKKSLKNKKTQVSKSKRVLIFNLICIEREASLSVNDKVMLNKGQYNPFAIEPYRNEITARDDHAHGGSSPIIPASCVFIGINGSQHSQYQ